MKTITAMAAVFCLLILAAVPEQAIAGGGKGRTCYTTDLFGPGFPGAQPITGKSRLCVTRRGINASMIARDLVPGEVYTVWWVYFDDPMACVGGGPGICGEADFGGEKPLAVLSRMDAAVAPINGKRWFTDSLRDFKPSEGSQIWLVLQRHGPAIEGGEGRARQLLTHEDLALGGAPHLTNSIDGQRGFPNSLAVFQLN